MSVETSAVLELSELGELMNNMKRSQRWVLRWEFDTLKISIGSWNRFDSQLNLFGNIHSTRWLNLLLKSASYNWIVDQFIHYKFEISTDL